MSSTQQQLKPETALQKLSATLWKMEDRFIKALPKHSNAQAEISSVLATVAASPNLQKCTPESIALAAYDAATLGLSVNKIGQAWLVPFGNEAKFQIGYKGYIQLVMDTGFVLDISVECVYENDKFSYALGSKPTINHVPPDKGSRGKFTKVYAIAFLANGLQKNCIMDKDQVDHIRSKSRSSGNGAWVTDYDEMAKKTVIKRLCKTLPYKQIPVSVDRAIEMEDAQESCLPQQSQLTPELSGFSSSEPAQSRATTEVDDVIDAEIVSGGESAQVDVCQQLISQIRDIQLVIKEKDKKAEQLPKELEDMTEGDLVVLLERKQKHYQLLK